MANKPVLDYIEHTIDSRAKVYVFWGKVNNSYEGVLQWLEDIKELFQMLGYPPTHYSLDCGEKVFGNRRINGLEKKLAMVQEEKMPIRSLSLEIFPPDHRDWIFDTAVMISLRYRPEDEYAPRSHVAFVVDLSYGLPLEEEKILRVLRKHIEANSGEICNMRVVCGPVFYPGMRDSLGGTDNRKLRKFVKKDGGEYWRDFMAEDKELQRLKAEGPYEEFRSYCEGLLKRYEADPEKAEAIENGIFSPETLEVVLKAAVEREPEDTVKMIRYVTKRGIEAEYREPVIESNFLGMLYGQPCRHWKPEQVLEITKLFVESGVDAGVPDRQDNPLIDLLLGWSDYMPLELEPAVAYLAEHGGKIGDRNKMGTSWIDDVLKGEKQREAMILRERYGKKEGKEPDDL